MEEEQQIASLDLRGKNVIFSGTFRYSDSPGHCGSNGFKFVSKKSAKKTFLADFEVKMLVKG